MISPKTSHGKKTTQKDTIKDISSDSQVNSNFPCRWSPASLTFNIYFYLFLYLYIITRRTSTSTSKITKEPKQKNRLGTASNIITAGGGGINASTSLRSTIALSSALNPLDGHLLQTIRDWNSLADILVFKRFSYQVYLFVSTRNWLP